MTRAIEGVPAAAPSGAEHAGAVAPVRPSYATFVVERPVAATRDAVWAALVDLVGSAGFLAEGDPAPCGTGATTARTLGERFEIVERVVSFEPPWRWVAEVISGAPVRLYQSTATIRDDGDRCLLVWSSLCEVGDDPLADEFLAAASAALQRTIELVAVAAETAAT